MCISVLWIGEHVRKPFECLHVASIRTQPVGRKLAPGVLMRIFICTAFLPALHVGDKGSDFQRLVIPTQAVYRATVQLCKQCVQIPLVRPNGERCLEEVVREGRRHGKVRTGCARRWVIVNLYLERSECKPTSRTRFLIVLLRHSASNPWHQEWRSVFSRLPNSS